MEDFSRFIGIPHYFGESSFDKCDCIGLCRLYYREHGWQDCLEDGLPVTEENFASLGVWRRLYTYCLKNMRRVDYADLSCGDFVVFKVEGALHTGIYAGYGKLLAMQIPTVYGKSRSTLYHRKWWQPFFRHAFRRRP